MNELKAWLSPTEARKIPKNTKQHALASLALRTLINDVFAPCPQLVDKFPPDGKSLLEPFLVEAHCAGLKFDWTLHGHLLIWMERNCAEALTEPILIELLAATANRWTMEDQSEQTQIWLASHLLPKRAVTGIKCRAPNEKKRFVLASVPLTLLPSEKIAFQITDVPSENKWLELPK
jgi:hypothetical protein